MVGCEMTRRATSLRANGPSAPVVQGWLAVCYMRFMVSHSTVTPPSGCNRTPLKLQPPINGGRFGNVEWAAAAAARPDAASLTPPAGLLPSAFAGLVFDAFACHL